MIDIEYVDLEWFGSIKKLRYYFNREGLNLIRGENGAGKTTIFNALYWCLYGKTIKKNCTVEPWPIIIDDTYKGTKVTVRYTKDGVKRTVTHCASYKKEVNGIKGKNGLFVFDDGKLIANTRDKKDGWRWIINDLGYTPELFKSSILFGQKVKRIMEEDGPTRNKVLEEAFEASFITQAKAKVDDRLRTSRPELNTIKITLDNYRERINSLQVSIKDMQRDKDNFDKDKEDTLTELKGKIDSLMLARKGFRKKLKKPGYYTIPMAKLAKRLEKMKKPNRKNLQDKEFRLHLEINRLEEQRDSKVQRQEVLKRSYTNMKRKCSACGQPIPPKEIKRQKKKIQEEMGALKKDIASDNIVIDAIKKDYDRVCKTLASFDSKIKRRSNIELRLKRLEGKLDAQGDIHSNIEVATARIAQYLEQLKAEQAKEFTTKLLKKFKKELKSTKVLCNDAEHKYNEVKKKVELDEWLIKDPLSNSGLKTFVLDAMLQKTNRELIKYEAVTGFRIQMGFESDTKRKEFYIRVYKKDLEIPHADLSGGQMQLCDLCIALAIHDTIDESKGCNIQLFDEVFESLSRQNIDKVGDLLMIKSKGKSIHIITHTSFNPSNARELNLEYKNMVTAVAA